MGFLRVRHCWELSGRRTKAERQDTEFWKHHTVGCELLSSGGGDGKGCRAEETMKEGLGNAPQLPLLRHP